jgi:hypothetical protein
MPEYHLVKAALAGISIMAALLLIFTLTEWLRLASGKELYTDKLIAYLEDIHNKTTPGYTGEVDVRAYYRQGNIKIMEIYFCEQPNEQPNEKEQTQTAGGEGKWLT